ncbi:MAG: hypothetical protein LBC83_06220 [Oscillospiraceae bacterium]|jgi:hypothetical protein|nr:hypothetical protein [Oscillospiraceae bacterium]
MRTKRIVSVLLAVLMTLSVFGVVSASAAASAVDGWVSVVDGFALDTTARTNGKEVYWTAFKKDAAGANNTDFWSILAAQGISYEWVVLYEGGTANMMGSSGVSKIAEESANKLTAIITPGNPAKYGKYEVTLALTKGTETRTSEVKKVWLVDDADYKDKLAKCNAILANPDNRYTGDYLDEVQAAVTNAKLLVDVGDPTIERYNQAETILQAALDLTPVYQLTGWDVVDQIFPQPLLKIIWDTVDTVNKALGFYNEWFGEDSWIYKNITSKMDITQIFGGLFNAFVALFKLAV